MSDFIDNTICRRLFLALKISLSLLIIMLGVGVSEMFRGMFLLYYGPFIVSLFFFLQIALHHRDSQLFMPALFCTLLAPFATWYVRAIIDTPYVTICLLVFNAAILWLVQSINVNLVQICGELEMPKGVVRLCRANVRFFIYLVIVPICLEYLLGFLSYDSLALLDNSYLANCWQPYPLVRINARYALIDLSLLATLYSSFKILHCIFRLGKETSCPQP